MSVEKVIVIVGPTAVGKTALGVQLAQLFNGEVISGDSMQVYRGLDIGTAKVTDAEKGAVPHHLIDVRDVDEPYTTSDFQQMGRAKINEITAREHIPIVVGGTGLYIESLLYNMSHGEADPDPDFRTEMEALADKESRQFVWEKLEAIDPEAADNIHPNNLVRTIRALEVHYVTGQKFSDYKKQQNERQPLYDTFIIGLNTDRELLYNRINQRVDLMMADGLIDEARWLDHAVGRDVQSIRGIGYKELFAYFDGNINLQEATSDIKQASRHYAKRQLTWFRNKTAVDLWVNLVEYPEELEQVKQAVRTFLKG
ncbi:tRNA (adenosine(37)-N6)-dimethylallyltransferase MiaA [Dolosigranulum pigrum]|uniref:tRNA (adenosine(37)-N6)-dimethylallyltransferase MiaA n=1 Tax=Dolosigranulum pigrum TaxID=29394 RepID=UPI001AD86EA9|nr:tRNA (adenosine(37)-N6)-dimethylallyltransferase MiaA [Dolosigranulum pigrum]QTJ36308.1 tRNA (adenosine(37)-N6)-dimethylallyltransferase MiaA [Dolosigranulum pigrum]